MIFKIKIEKLQPSQLYISKHKLEQVKLWLKNHMEDYEPIPVKLYKGKWIITDGHTRTFALYEFGVKEIRVIEDEDDLDWKSYSTCLNWCLGENIETIKDLNERLIEHDKYKILWIDRCHDILNAL